MPSPNFLRRLYLPLLLLLCVGYALRPMGGGYDFWAHAAVGRWVWNHHAFPEYSLFLWSVDRFPWVAHSWLSQLIFYGLLEGGGGWKPVGARSVGSGPLFVMLITTAISCATWAILWRLWNRNSWSFRRFGERVPISFLTPVIFALAVWTSAPRYLPRQEMFTALILTCLLSYLIERRPARGRTGDGRLETGPRDVNSSDEETSHAISSTRSDASNLHLPTSDLSFRFGWREFAWIATFLLWVNLHALVLLGLVFLFVTAFCDCVQDRFDSRSRILLAVFVLCALATLFNPFGVHWLDSAFQLKKGNMANNIDEWKPIWQAKNLRPCAVTEFGLAALALLAWAFNPNRRWAHAIWVVIMTILLWKQRRHLWLAALVFVAVMAANAGFFDSRVWWARWKMLMREPEMAHQLIPLGMRRIAQGGIALILVICVWQSMQHPWPRSMVESKVPEAAAFALESGQKNGSLPRGNLFNDYENSSYFQWRLNRAGANGIVSDKGLNPLYIDLLNAYPDGKNGLLNEYFVFLQGNVDAKSSDKTPGLGLLQSRKINLVCIRRELDDRWLPQYLTERPKEWRLVHEGKDCRLWVRIKPLPLTK